MSGPTFICPGAQKAGTTWLHKHLKRHPDFWMPPQKEMDYLAPFPGSRTKYAERLEGAKHENARPWKLAALRDILFRMIYLDNEYHKGRSTKTQKIYYENYSKLLSTEYIPQIELNPNFSLRVIKCSVIMCAPYFKLIVKFGRNHEVKPKCEKNYAE